MTLFLFLCLHLVLLALLLHKNVTEHLNMMTEMVGVMSPYTYNVMAALFNIICANYALNRVKMYRQGITQMDTSDVVLTYISIIPFTCVLQYETLDAALLKLCTTFVTVMLARWAGLAKSDCEAEQRIKKIKFPVGANFADAMFRWLENVVNGKVNKKGIRLNLPFEEALAKYKREIGFQEGTDWFYEKIIILCPEWKGEGYPKFSPGSIKDLQEEAKEGQFSIVKSICCEYTASGGQGRVSEVEVLRIEDTKNNCFGFVAVAENRQVKTMNEMVLERGIQFTKKDLSLQLNIYMKTLQSLLDGDEECRKNCQIFYYEVYEKKNFGKHFVAKFKN